MAQGHLKWDQNELIYEKNQVQKISRDCPFKVRYVIIRVQTD